MSDLKNNTLVNYISNVNLYTNLKDSTSIDGGVV